MFDGVPSLSNSQNVIRSSGSGHYTQSLHALESTFNDRSSVINRYSKTLHYSHVELLPPVVFLLKILFSC